MEEKTALDYTKKLPDARLESIAQAGVAHISQNSDSKKSYRTLLAEVRKVIWEDHLKELEDAE